MKAMILAAGRGERMRPLTDALPKPLLRLRGRALIEYPLCALAAAGVREFVINLGYRGAQIREHLGDGAAFGVRIAYSEEGDPPLETGGGLFHALPLLGAAPFIVVNADVYAEYPWDRLLERARQFPDDRLAHLVLVPVPCWRARGDFALRDGRIDEALAPEAVFAGISILRPELFAQAAPGRYSVVPLLRAAARAGRVGGERFDGPWSDLGTPQRLAELEALLARPPSQR